MLAQFEIEFKGGFVAGLKFSISGGPSKPNTLNFFEFQKLIKRLVNRWTGNIYILNYVTRAYFLNGLKVLPN